MRENPRSLIAEATKIVADVERFLETAVESVRAIPAKRKEALEADAAAKEREKQAWAEWERVRVAKLSKRHKDIANRKFDRASKEAWRANQYLASDAFDTEYQKAVARQIAGLLREESEQKLDDISTRSDDPELQRTVAECREEVGRTTRYVITTLAAGGDLQPAEVRKARAEADAILEHQYPPVDE